MAGIYSILQQLKEEFAGVSARYITAYCAVLLTRTDTLEFLLPDLDMRKEALKLDTGLLSCVWWVLNVIRVRGVELVK